MLIPTVPTPHIEAQKGQIAETVLMPGDPKRAAFIARNYLTDSVLVNDVRGVQGYTGAFRGVPVTVMASGMGMPSIAIYSYELFAAYGVERIIRTGTAGGLCARVAVRDLVLAQGACTDSAYASHFGLNGTFAPIASFALLEQAALAAREQKLPFCVGNVLSTDAFYGGLGGAQETSPEMWGRLGVLAVEMEAAALYMNAARFGKQALAICTVSDHLLTGEAMDSAEREQGMDRMIRLSLDVAVRAHA